MNCYESLTKGEGYHTLIQRLKDGFGTYKRLAQNFDADFKKDKTKCGIISWHYRRYLHLRGGGDSPITTNGLKCECTCYGKKKKRSCKCLHHMNAWLETACLIALVMPSSGASERVFSLVNNHFGNQQMTLFSYANFPFSLFVNEWTPHLIILVREQNRNWKT